MTAFSVLDLAPIIEGGDATDAFARTTDLAQHAEAWGYKRFWLAEHHSMPGIASAATSVLIGHVAGATRTIRVGAGGIMLPNHAPLQIAEQFGTLAALYPGRIDLGLGRAPGSDQLTARALRRTLNSDPDRFPEDVIELRNYFKPALPGQRLQAVPGAGLDVPIWILGSSTFGAQVAAHLGLPFGFASHFAPGMLMQALEIYRARFQPSQQLDKPYVLVGLNVTAAESDDEAAFLSTSMQQSIAQLRRGAPGKLAPPRRDFTLAPAEQAMLEQFFTHAAIGAPDTVRARMRDFIALTNADEVMITGQVYDHAARLRSFEIAAEIGASL